MPRPAEPRYDVAIAGGGPGGSTTGALLKKYAPELSVVILEKERFPREHVGESQLPPIGAVLDEMGCWDKVEAANFPIKIGGTFRWGQNRNLWDIQFIPRSDFQDEPRPARYRGQRTLTAFQVDRAIYDQILLDHAAELGCEVRQETRVREVFHDGDRVTGLGLEGDEVVTARWYVDATGYHGLLRSRLGVATHSPTLLQNIAIWDYWTNAEWAVEIGVGGTLVQVVSLGYGWIWFIPLGPERTSIGLVCPAHYYKELGKAPEELYREAIASEPFIGRLTARATRDGEVRTTKDWSFLAERTAGENWLLVGESAGFADPILSAGLTLTHHGGREAAYTLAALARGEHDPEWLKHHFDRNQRLRIRQHMRFAEFFYAANGQFTELKEHCSDIAREAGFDLEPQQAWEWISKGGFTNQLAGLPFFAGFDIDSAKQVTELLTQKTAPWSASDYNVFHLDLTGARRDTLPLYEDGRVQAVPCYLRGDRRLPLIGTYGLMVQILRNSADIQGIIQDLISVFKSKPTSLDARVALRQALQVLEVMVSEGWVVAELDESKPRINLATPTEGTMIYTHDGTGAPAAAAEPS